MESFHVALPSRGGSMHALAWGPRERPVDVVFLHANGFNALTYRAVLEPLGASLHVVALDQRGHGLTTLPTMTEGRDDWLDLRDDLLAALAALRIKGAVISGHSMGGTVSILAAAADPKVARALLLLDPVIVLGPRRADPHSPMVEAARRRRGVFESRRQVFASYRGRGAFRTWPDVMLADYLSDGLRDLPGGQVGLTCAPSWEASGYSAHGHDTRAAISALRSPTKVLKAEEASTCGLEDGDFAPPGGLSVETLPGTTHFLPMERPERVRRALADASTVTV